MRIVFLTAHSPEGEAQHRYVAKELADAFPTELMGIIVATGVPRSTRERIKRWRRRYSMNEIASRLVVRAAHRVTGEQERKRKKIEQVLFPLGDDGRMPRPDLVKRVVSHNSTTCAEMIASLKPDFVIVYGTLILGKKLINSMPMAINMHTGLSPRYRGSDTNFWPLFNQEPEHLGATIHRLDSGIDSGAILARGRSAITPNDDEHTLFAKAVKIGADLLCKSVLREAEGGTKPALQTLSEGQEYRSVERTLTAEIRVRRLLKRGLLGKGLPKWREEF